MNERRTTRRRGEPGVGHFQAMIATNAVAAVRDESYTLVAKIVDDLLRDPEVARKIEYHTRQIFRLLAAKM